MKKQYILISIMTLLIVLIGGFLIFSKTQNRSSKTIAGVKTNSAEASKKLIAANTKKYQPQITKASATSGLNVNAKSAIVVDQNKNTVLYQKEPHLVLPPASITKVATISVALETLKKDQLIAISQTAANQEPNKIVMKPSEKMRAEDLFYGLMMISANDAAWAIAEAIPGGFPKFINKMNLKAKELGLKNTHFENPAGLDEPNHLTTVWDITTFTRYGILKHPEWLNYAGYKKDYSVYPNQNNESHWWSHISHMLYAYPGMTAAKTGYTDNAKSTFVGVAERNGRQITVVLMGSTDANGDVKALLDYGFSH